MTETDWKLVLQADGKGPRVRDGNRVDYLVDGWAAYRAMYDAIRTTFSNGPGFYIYLLAWWLDDNFPLVPDDSGSTMSTLLRKAAQDFGVQIRVILWLNMLASLAPYDPKAQARQRDEINKLASGACVIDAILPTQWRSHHQKLLVVKGAQGLAGFCGGLDIAKDRVGYVRFHTGSPFHDVHCRVEGDAACDLVDVFAQRWLAHPLSQSVDQKKGALKGLSDRRPPGNRNPVGTQSVAIARTFNTYRPGTASGQQLTWCAEELSVMPMLIAAIRAAKRFIYIEDQYLVGMEAAEELRRALSRIQHITILIPAETDLPYNEPARAKFVYLLWSDKATAAKVRVFHRPKGEHAYIHSKTWIIDDELAVIGSPNVNRRGWAGDSEVAAAIFDRPASAKEPSFAQRLRIKLWSEHLGVDENSLRDGMDPMPWVAAAKRGKVLTYIPFLEASPEEAARFPDPNEKVSKIGVRLAAWLTGYKGPMNVKAVWDTVLDPPDTPAHGCPGSEMRRAH